MSSDKKTIESMVSEDLLFIPRGEVEKIVPFNGAELHLRIKVMTNKETDTLKQGFCEIIGQDVEIDTPGVAEAFIKEGLIDINTTFHGKKWIELNDEEKSEAVSAMHPDLRDIILKEVQARSSLTKEEKGFLSKQC